MPRTLRNLKLDTRSARRSIKQRREPYWVVISAGCAVGYRKGERGGTWIARYRSEDGQRHYEALGAADDVRDADGHSALTFAQAQKRAHEFFAIKAREAAGDFTTPGLYTVAGALADYLAHREAAGHTSVERDRISVRALILPDLGEIEVHRLTKKRIQEWFTAMAATPMRLRTAKGKNQKFAEKTDAPDQLRRRRATANRVLAILKAALNLAHREGKAPIADAWARIAPFPAVKAARLRYLKNDSEAQRLVNACSGEFQALVIAALLTGIRYGDLSRLTVQDFTNTLRVEVRKSKKTIMLGLGEEAQTFFAAQCRGKHATDLLLPRPGGGAWRTGDQQIPMREACKAAGIDYMSFHGLRHSYASRLVMKGVPLALVANQLGHASIKEVEQHYGHLCPNYVADTIRTASTPIGLFEDRTPRLVSTISRK